MNLKNLIKCLKKETAKKIHLIIWRRYKRNTRARELNTKLMELSQAINRNDEVGIWSGGGG